LLKNTSYNMNDWLKIHFKLPRALTLIFIGF
jgi:hypothetical protein